MMGKMGVCDWISWLIGLVAAVVVFTTSVGEVTWIPALLIAIAVGSFLGLVLSHLFCGGADELHGAGGDRQSLLVRVVGVVARPSGDERDSHPSFIVRALLAAQRRGAGDGVRVLAQRRVAAVVAKE